MSVHCESCRYDKTGFGCRNNNEFCCSCGKMYVKCYHIYKPDNFGGYPSYNFDRIIANMNGDIAYHSSCGKFCMQCIYDKLKWEEEFYREEFEYTGEVILQQISECVIMMCTKGLYDKIVERGYDNYGKY